MSKKLTFEEWIVKQDNLCKSTTESCFDKKCINCDYGMEARQAWNFAQAQEQKEAQAKQAMYDEKYTEIHKANVVLMDERDIIRKENDSLWVENEDLTRKIEKLEQEVARLREENLRMRNCTNCKHSSMLGKCLHPNHPATLNCRCNLWENK